MSSESVAWRHDPQAAEALRDFQTTAYDFARLELPDRMGQEHWGSYCHTLCELHDAEWRAFSQYLAARPPLGFESWDHYTGLMRSFYNLRRGEALAAHTTQLLELDLDQLVFGTIPSGQPSATIAALRGSRSPAVLLDVGLQRALPWVSLLYAIMMEPVGPGGYHMVPSRVTEDGNAIAVALGLADRLVEYLTIGVIGYPPNVEGRPEWMSQIERSQAYVTELFIVGHEIAHLLLGHVRVEPPSGGHKQSLPGHVDPIQTTVQSHAEEFDADLLGLKLAILANRAVLSSKSVQEQALHDGQAVAFIEFFLWFYQAIEVLLCRQRFGQDSYYADTESHPSATLRRFTFKQRAVHYLTGDPRLRNSGLDELIVQNLNSNGHCHSHVWSIVIHVAHSKLQQKLAAGGSLAPIWNALRPCDVHEFLHGRPVSPDSVLGSRVGDKSGG